MKEDVLLFTLRNKDYEVAEIPAESSNSTYTVVAFTLNNGWIKKK